MRLNWKGMMVHCPEHEASFWIIDPQELQQIVLSETVTSLGAGGVSIQQQTVVLFLIQLQYTGILGIAWSQRT